MKEVKIYCDKCNKDITSDIDRHHIEIDDAYKFDFCDNCYGTFIRTIGSWLKDKE